MAIIAQDGRLGKVGASPHPRPLSSPTGRGEGSRAMGTAGKERGVPQKRRYALVAVGLTLVEIVPFAPLVGSW
jgi:hypothetical protein